MSVLIEQVLQDENDKQSITTFKEHLKQYLHFYQPTLFNGYQDYGRQINFIMKEVARLVETPTLWAVSMLETHLKITVLLLEQGSMIPYHVSTERLKIQAARFLRELNSEMVDELKFILQPSSGLISAVFNLRWDAYIRLFRDKKIKVKQLFQKFLMEPIQKYVNQLGFFWHLSGNRKQETEIKLQEKMRRYRYLLTARQLESEKLRNQKREIMEKTGRKEVPLCELQLANYFNILDEINDLGFGIQEIYKSEYDRQVEFKEELKKINGHIEDKHGRTPNPKEKYKPNSMASRKLVWGIRDVKTTSEAVKISEEGTHSRIFAAKFSFLLNPSINPIDFGNYKQLQTRTEQYLAFKECKLNNPSSKSSFLNQLDVLQRIRDLESPYIPRYFLEVSKETQKRSAQQKIYMYCYRSNLYDLIQKAEAMDVRQKIYLCYRICKGLCFFSENSILHRDIKPQNIIVDQHNTPKIIDFGSAAPVYVNTVLCTRQFHIEYKLLSPEIRERYPRQMQYDQHKLFDVYSFGKTMNYVFFKKLEHPMLEDLRNFYPKPALIQNLCYLIDVCTDPDPENRPGFGEICAFLEIMQKMTRVELKRS